ncbi:MAG: hypothetical protein KF878_00280 [Planctomycetes bacterium]|nr:hypothetical protein [Planctomycetota bacterium]
MPERCRKRAYTSVRAARLAHRSASWRLRVYRCADCLKFHICNQEKRRSQ